jgi:DNA replication and repair protein RecF
MFSVLTLSNFRNHESSRINTAGAKNVFISGPNGSGKTALLEALSMFSGNGGLRGASMPELSKLHSDGGFAVHAELNNGTTLSATFTSTDNGRKIRIDNDPMPLSAASTEIRIVWLTPKEDRLFAESASDRRAFLDRLAGGFDPVHTGRVARLAKLLSERAFALKSNGDSAWMNALETQLASVAASVAAARVSYAAQLNHFLQAETDAHIVVSGWFESKLAECGNCSDVEKEYIEYLRDNRALCNGNMVILGAHRSDFSMFRQGLDINAGMMSAGQQKKLLLLLIIAHAKLLQARQSAPIAILLDEAESHLDAENFADVLQRLNNTPAQVWMTGVRLADSDKRLAVSECAPGTIPQANCDVASLFVSCVDGKVSCKVEL